MNHARPTLLLATRNPGKLRELRPLLDAAGWHAITLVEAGLVEVPEEEHLETGSTFEANARAKARYFAKRSGKVVLADDSGLEVDALDGQPGVWSKRWSGRSDLEGAALDAANNATLLSALQDAARHGRNERSARFVCVAAAASGADEWSARGETAGIIREEPRGQGGFGYDPYFASDELGGLTLAEVDGDTKSRISHRGRAFRTLLSALGNSLTPVDRDTASR